LPKLPRLTAQQAEKMLFEAGFELIRIRGSHYIYKRESNRVVVPHHSGQILHPKIVKQVIDAISAEPDSPDDESI
jgi:predicted RNA binding protein YcfA (HicA-like mRNA interferase family)